MNNSDEYERMLKILSQQARVALMGSFCLYYTYPEILEKDPPDADLLTINNKENLKTIIEIFLNNGYSVFSWKDAIKNSDFDFSNLNYRYYFRAVKDDIVFDITYYNEYYSFESLENHIFTINSIKVLDKSAMILIYRVCNNVKHNRIIEILDSSQC